MAERGDVAGGIAAVEVGQGAEEVVVGRRIVGPAAARAVDLGFSDLRLDEADDGLGDAVLELEDLAELAVKTLGPLMGTGLGVDELDGDPHAAAGKTDAAFEEIADAELIGDLAGIYRAVLVNEGRVAGDDGEGLEPAQRCDEVLDDAVGEIVLGRIAAEVGEREHGERGFSAFGGNRTGRDRRGGRDARQPVADAGNGDDPVLAIGARAELFAERGDLDRDVPFLDRDAGPCALHQLGFGDDLAGGFEKGAEDGERALANGHGLALARQLATGVEDVGSEGMALVLHGREASAPLSLGKVAPLTRPSTGSG